MSYFYMYKCTRFTHTHTHMHTQADEDETIPEELANIIVRKPNDLSTNSSSLPDHSPQGSVSEDYLDSLGDPNLRDELARVKKLLVEEQEQSAKLVNERGEMGREIEKLQSKMSELNRRHGDATRAYEQAKKVSVFVAIVCCSYTTCTQVYCTCICVL